MALRLAGADNQGDVVDYHGKKLATKDSVATKVTGTGITEIRSLSQASYDALTPKVATTLYLIVG